jgi:hypothetical protein
MMEAVLAAGATERQCRCARARRRDGGSPSGGGTGGVQGTRRGKRGIGGLKSEGGATSGELGKARSQFWWHPLHIYMSIHGIS